MNLFGILHNNTLLTAMDGEKQIEMHPYMGFWNLGKLFDLASKHLVRQLWISKGSSFYENIRHARDNGNHSTFWTETGKWTLAKGELKNTISAWIEGQHGSTKQVIFPGLFDEGWSFDTIEDPYLLYNAIEGFKERLQVMPSFPFKVSKLLFEQAQSKPLPNLPEFYGKTPEEFWQPFIEKTESEFIQIRELDKDEKKLPFVHAFDKRMMFLSAARSASFGVGNFEEIDSIHFDKIPKGTPGICEVEPVDFNDPMRPELSEWFRRLFDGQTRFMTPYLELFDRDLNCVVKVRRGWIWKKPERLFEKFAVTLGTAVKDVRDDPDPVSQVLRQALKPVYTNFFGWLGRLDKRTGYAAELYRPDWRAQIVSLAGANLLRNVIEVWTHTRRLPFAIYHDCLMYFSESDRHDVDFAKTCLVDSNRFTHEWTIAGKRVLKAIKDGGGPAIIDKLHTEPEKKTRRAAA